MRIGVGDLGRREGWLGTLMVAIHLLTSLREEQCSYRPRVLRILARSTYIRGRPSVLLTSIPGMIKMQGLMACVPHSRVGRIITQCHQGQQSNSRSQTGITSCTPRRLHPTGILDRTDTHSMVARRRPKQCHSLAELMSGAR